MWYIAFTKARWDPSFDENIPQDEAKNRVDDSNTKRMNVFSSKMPSAFKPLHPECIFYATYNKRMLSLFVPLYNEEGIIEKSVQEIKSALDGLEFEVWLVDDASNDSSAEICKRLALQDARVGHLRYDEGPTRRENLADAMRAATGEFVGFIDADLSMKPSYIPGFLNLLADCDIVVASRLLAASRASRRRWRDSFSRMASFFARNYLGSGLSDHQCGLKLFRREALMGLLGEMGYDKSLVRGWSWDTEMLVRAQKKGLRIREEPVEWIESPHTSVNIRRDWRMIPYIFSLRKKLKY